MIRDARGAGCEVGLTTNGDLLDEAAGWIVAEGVDVLTLSLAGIDGSDRRLRDSGDTRRLLETLAVVAGRRTSRGRPRIQVSYLLTRDNADEILEVIRVASGCGADAVLVNHLDGVFSHRLLDLAAYTDGRVPRPTRDILDEAMASARRHRITLRRPTLEPQEMLTCALDPRRIVSVRWDGRVGPCVHLNLPIEGPVSRWTRQGQIRVDQVCFGRLDDSSLSEILAGEAYRDFTGPLRLRCEADERFRDEGLVASAWGDVAVRELEAAHRILERALEESPFPPGCLGCPKRWGW